MVAERKQTYLTKLQDELSELIVENEALLVRRERACASYNS